MQEQEDIEMDEPEAQSHPIAMLEAQGINNGDVNKLKGGGFYTVESVAYATMKKLTEVKGISEAKALKIMAECKKIVPMGFTTATEIAQSRYVVFVQVVQFVFLVAHKKVKNIYNINQGL